MKRMTLPVEVSADDIENGERESYSSCPIAIGVGRAARSQGIDVDWVSVDGYRIEIEDEEGRTWEAKCTAAMKQFVIEFDNCGTVNPFTIDVEFIDEELAELTAESDDDDED